MKIGQFIEDGSGEFSSTRLLMMVVLGLLVFDWIYAVFLNGTYSISWEKVTLVSAVFGLKGIQTFAENVNDKNYPANETTITTQTTTLDKSVTKMNPKDEVDG
jgi:hypothetical protein